MSTPNAETRAFGLLLAKAGEIMMRIADGLDAHAPDLVADCAMDLLRVLGALTELSARASSLPPELQGCLGDAVRDLASELIVPALAERNHADERLPAPLGEATGNAAACALFDAFGRPLVFEEAHG